MTPPGTPKTCKNAEKHAKTLFGFGGRFLARRSAVEERGLEGFAAGVGPIGGGRLRLAAMPVFVCCCKGLVTDLAHRPNAHAHSAENAIECYTPPQCTDRSCRQNFTVHEFPLPSRRPSSGFPTVSALHDEA